MRVDVESFSEPAKQAERVVAPGDGEAEPGVTSNTRSKPTKWATDETFKVARTDHSDSTDLK